MNQTTIDSYLVGLFTRRPRIGQRNPPGEITEVPRIPICVLHGQIITPIVFPPATSDYVARYAAVLTHGGQVVDTKDLSEIDGVSIGDQNDR